MQNICRTQDTSERQIPQLLWVRSENGKNTNLTFRRGALAKSAAGEAKGWWQRLSSSAFWGAQEGGAFGAWP